MQFPVSLLLGLSDADVLVVDKNGHRRLELEAFVASEFRRQYGANVTHFMPWLLGISHEGHLAGVAGLRPASLFPLFIEQYISSPIEDSLSECTGYPIARNTIIEIGNLAGNFSGITRVIFPLLTELVAQRGYSWVVCNATRSVQNALAKLGFSFLPLQKANPDKLGEARFSWGRYYETESTVIAISVSDAHNVLVDKIALLENCEIALMRYCNTLPLSE